MADSGAPSNPSTHNLSRSAGVIGIATMTSRVLGLVRDQVMAYLFGAGSQMDAYNVAFRIPNLVRDLFAEGAMSAAFVPDVHPAPHPGRPGARLAARQPGHHDAGARHGVIVLLGIVFAGPLTRRCSRGSYAGARASSS